MVHSVEPVRQLVLALSFLPAVFLLVSSQDPNPQYSSSDGLTTSNQSDSSTCSAFELNFSNLVECNLLGCKVEDIPPVWPTVAQPFEKADIIHMYSSKFGDRFVVKRLKNLDHMESFDERNFDINSTLQVSDLAIQKIMGIGASINPRNLASVSSEFAKNILNELFSESRLGLSILKVDTTKEAVKSGTFGYFIFNFTDLYPDRTQLKSKTATKLIISVDELLDSIEDLETINYLETISYGSALDLQVVALKPKKLLPSEEDMMQDVFSKNGVFADASDLDPSMALSKLEMNNIYDGLVLKWWYGTPYDIMDSFRDVTKGKRFLTVGSEGPASTSEPGDWQRGQEYAVQILNLFKHSSNGFIDIYPVVNLFNEYPSHDRPIYSLDQNDGLYFRGPMYYALGHFSRYIVPGSVLLRSSIETQTNMFAAQYGAFRTPDGHIVVIVLNDNEHLLPFRVRLWNNKVVVHVELKAKSFNTIIIKP